MFTTRKRLSLIAVAFSILLSMPTISAHAADIEKGVYDKGFGAKEAAVRASRSPKKIAEFAGELLESAKLVKEDQPYQAYLFNKTYEIGMLFPDGIPFAVEAMDQLATAQPQLKASADANLLNAMQRRYQTSAGSERTAAASAYIDRALQIADSLAADGKYDEAVIICDKAKIALAASAARHNDVVERVIVFKDEETAARHIAALKAALKTTPHDAVAAGELVQLLMLDTDTPDQAIPYVDATANAKLKRIVGLAAKDAATLTDGESLELGDWYRGQTIKGGKLATETAWSRAKLCYQRFLDAHPKLDADHLNATRAMKDAEIALGKLPHPIGSTRTREDRPAPLAGNIAGSERIVLFDGSDLSKWRRLGGGPPGFAIINAYLEARNRDIETVEVFEDFRLHLEFATSDSPPGTTGQGRSNSGVFLQGRYEIQILDSVGVKNFGAGDCGAIWGQVAPTKNLCRAPGQWQTYDIEFHAAKFAGGGKTTPARLTLVWNGEKVLDNVEISGTTPLGDAEAGSPGPIRLQYQGSPVRFRNIWLERIGTADPRNVESSAVPQGTTSPVTSPSDATAYLHSLGIETGREFFVAGIKGPRVMFQRPIPSGEWPRLLGVLNDTAAIAFANGSGTDDACIKVAKLPKLGFLDFSQQPVTDTGIAALAQHPSLEAIALTNSHVTQACLADLATIPNLTWLIVPGTHCSGTLKALVHCQRLLRLEAGGNPITDQDIADLVGIPKLEQLDLDGTQVTAACVNSLAKIPSLQNLAIPNSFNEEGIVAVARLPHLAKLGLRKSQIGPQSLRALAKTSTLLDLQLVGRLTNSDTAALSECTQLRTLVLWSTDLSDDQMEHVGRLTGLTLLDLGSNTQIDDAGISRLSGLTQLQNLTLNGTRITNQGLATVLQNSPNLDVVFVRGTGVTREAIEDLKRKYPHVRLEK